VSSAVSAQLASGPLYVTFCAIAIEKSALKGLPG
jgi:hypothetical protein